MGIVEVEGAIRAGQLPVLGVSLPEPFFTPVTPWVIPSGGAIRGLHAVAGVGIGSFRGGRVIMIRNSWGSDWGDDGHVWLDDAFIGQHLKRVMVLTHEIST